MKVRLFSVPANHACKKLHVCFRIRGGKLYLVTQNFSQSEMARGKGTETKKRTKKNKDGPKKPMSAYILFSNKRRVEIIKDKPELKSKITEISKLIGEEWRGLTDTDKAPFAADAAKDKERYQKDLEAAAAAK
eukprot:Lankesteria_metandrocarpae@DN4106_c0_g1_i2.p2